MPRHQQIYQQIEELDPVEREEFLLALFMRLEALPRLLPWRHAQEFPSIVSTPGVCGGEARLVRTRIPVWTLERMRQLGVTEADILRSYPTLRAADLVQAWDYIARHRDDIEKAIRNNEEE